MKLLKSLKNTDGQAIVEFVLVVPTMLIILVFSQYFYEAIQVKLKTQEMARYMAWEFTGYQLHDYGSGQMKYSGANSSILGDAKARFSNLKSTDKKHNANFGFVGSWQIRRARTRNQKVPAVPNATIAGININTIINVLGLAFDAWRVASIAQTGTNPVWMAMVAWYTTEEHNLFGGGGLHIFNPPGEWKFNQKGYIRSEVTMTFDNVYLSRGLLSKGSWFSEQIRLPPIQFKEHYVLVADSWRLHYGEDINGPSSSGTAYYKQLSRMAFLTGSVRNVLKTFTDIIKGGTDIIAYLSFQPTLGMNSLTEVALVSKNYKEDGTSGKIQIGEDESQKTYDTSPYYGGGDHTDENSYIKTLDIRGEHYMACPQQESMGCTSSLSTENPFGEYIIPQELEGE